MKSIQTSISQQGPDWGRRKSASAATGVKAAILMSICPILTLLLAANMEKHHGNLRYIADMQTLLDYLHGLSYQRLLPMHVIIAGYLLIQALLFAFCPGPHHTGQYTPGGQLLSYKTNGLAAFAITYAFFWFGHLAGVFDGSILARNFSTLIAAANIWGLFGTIVAYLKGCFFPSSVADRVFTGSLFYDLCMGLELNPRIPVLGDLKLFVVSRIGMMVWPLVLTSFAILQHQTRGHVSAAMLVGVVLQFEYIIDFFWNEHWYLRTIDIAHDHVGFYMIWGCMAWLPTTYTMHVQYIAHSEVPVGDVTALVLFVLGTCGYLLFRLSNNQRYEVRNNDGQKSVWGKPARYITAHYTTADGAKRRSILLTSGWWGLARHINYVGDLVLTYATCATTGTLQLLPWFYAVYMTILLMHRCLRDEARCSKKYGPDWEKYRQMVRWRLIPYLL